MFIGITGLIGSGKSSAAAVFKSLGAMVIDADKIGKEVVESSPPLLKKLAKKFGADILDRSGQLNRGKLAGRVFSDDNSKQELDRLVHPYLLKHLRAQMKSGAASHEVVVVDAALLLDWNLDDEMDYVLCIHAGLQTRLRRLKLRGISKPDALARQRQQLSFHVYRARSDRIILNNGTKDDLKRKLVRWVRDCRMELLTEL